MYCYIFELIGESYDIPVDEVLSILLSNDFKINSYYLIKKYLFIFINKNEIDTRKKKILKEKFKDIVAFTK